MKSPAQSMAILLAAFLVSNAFCFGQDLTGGGIQCQGEAVVERKPESMRMSIDLLARGENMADAVAKLKERRTKAEQQLVTLGAVKDSWKFGEIRLDQTQINRRKQLQMLIIQRAAMAGQPGAGKDKNAAATPAPVDLAMKLTAEWPLKEADPDEMLITAQKLQETIKSAHISGAGDPDETSDEESELAEEMEGMEGVAFGGVFRTSVGLDNSSEQKPGEPSFVFVAKISATERQKAMNEAFVLAKAEASQLAEAAQLKLGAPRSLNSSSGVDTDDPSESQAIYYPGGYNFNQRRTTSERANEAVGTMPGLLKYKVTVNVTFAFK